MKIIYQLVLAIIIGACIVLGITLGLLLASHPRHALLGAIMVIIALTALGVVLLNQYSR